MNSTIKTSSTLDSTVISSSLISELDLTKVQLKPINQTNNALIKKPSMNASILDQIKEGVKLKKIEINTQAPIKLNNMRPSLINKQESNFLQQTLFEAIKQRKIALDNGNIEESDESNSDWSD